LKLGSACSHWVQDLLHFLLSKKAKIKIKTTIISYGCMVWYGVNSSDTGQGPVVGSFEHGYEISDRIKYWEIFE
jgi:hypothetical protein